MERHTLNTLYECFGLPGGGKSTVSALANETLKLPDTSDISTYWRLAPLTRKTSILLHSLTQEFPLWLELARFIVKNKITSRKSLLYLVKIPAQKILIVDFLKKQPLLLDQWQLQNLWSAILNAKLLTVSGLLPLLRTIYKDIPVQVFYFQLPIHVAAGRIASRQGGRSRFDVMPDHVINDELARAAGMLEKIVETAQVALPDIDVLDSQQTIDKTSENLILAAYRARQ